MQDLGKVAIFIDGSNLWQTCRNLNMKINFKQLREWAAEQNTIWLGYYTGLVSNRDEENPLIKMTDWLSYNGYIVVKKQASTVNSNDSDEERIIKGNIDVDITVDMMLMAENVDTIILFSGDGDFIPVVEAVQRKYGVYVICVSSTKPVNIVSGELRRKVNQFIELDDLRETIAYADKYSDEEDIV